MLRRSCNKPSHCFRKFWVDFLGCCHAFNCKHPQSNSCSNTRSIGPVPTHPGHHKNLTPKNAPRYTVSLRCGRTLPRSGVNKAQYKNICSMLGPCGEYVGLAMLGLCWVGHVGPKFGNLADFTILSKTEKKHDFRARVPLQVKLPSYCDCFWITRVARMKTSKSHLHAVSREPAMQNVTLKQQP